LGVRDALLQRGDARVVGVAVGGGGDDRIRGRSVTVVKQLLSPSTRGGDIAGVDPQRAIQTVGGTHRFLQFIVTHRQMVMHVRVLAMLGQHVLECVDGFAEQAAQHARIARQIAALQQIRQYLTGHGASPRGGHGGAAFVRRAAFSEP